MSGKMTITTGRWNAESGTYERSPYVAPSPQPAPDAAVPSHPEESPPQVDPSVFEEVAQDRVQPDTGPEPTATKTPVDLKYVQDKARRLVAIEDRLEELADEEKQLKEEQRLIRIFQLPEALFELEISPPIIGVGNRVVEVEPLITASLPPVESAEMRQKALETVIDLGLGGNIKYTLEIDFPKGDAITEAKVIDAINAVSADLKPRVNATIHHSTYTAMIKRLINAGKVIDRTVLGVFVGNIARVRKVKDD